MRSSSHCRRADRYACAVQTARRAPIKRLEQLELWGYAGGPAAPDREMLTCRTAGGHRRAHRLYRSHQGRPPRPRPVLMIALLTVVLGVGMAAVVTPRAGIVLDASVSAAAPGTPCRAPATPGATVTPAAAPPASSSTTAPGPATSATATPCPSAVAVAPAAARTGTPRRYA